MPSNNNLRRSNNGRGGIPIPSFGGCSIDSSPDSSLANATGKNMAKAVNNKTSSSLIVTPANNSHGNNSNPKKSYATAASVTAASTTVSSNDAIQAKWNVTALMQLEVSLQHWFRRHKNTKPFQRGSAAPSTGTTNKTAKNALQQQEHVLVMPLDDFYKLVQKLDWSQANLAAASGSAANAEEGNEENPGEETITNGKSKVRGNHQHTATKKKKNELEEPKQPSSLVSHGGQIRGLSWEERLLHDLLCIAAPPPATTMAQQQPLYRILNLECNDKKMISLESLPHSSDQLRRALSSTKTFSKAWSDQIRDRMVQYRNAKETTKAVTASVTTAGNKAPLQLQKAIITKGMTLEERVSARAKARQQHEQLLQDQRSNQNDNDTNDKSGAVDQTWMIQMADALWTQARMILQRQNCHLPGKLASNSILLANNNNKRAATTSTATTDSSSPTSTKPMSVKRRCVMTFQDVVRITAKSRLGEASPLEVAKILTELERYEPQWITIMRTNKNDPVAQGASSSSSNPHHQSPKSLKWCKTKNTTIFFFPDLYPAVRSQMTGMPMSNQRNNTKIDLRIKSQQGPALATKRKENKVLSQASSATNENNKHNMNKRRVTLSVPGKAKASPKTVAVTTADANTIINNERKRPSPVPTKNLLQAFDENNDSKRIRRSL